MELLHKPYVGISLTLAFVSRDKAIDKKRDFKNAKNSLPTKISYLTSNLLTI